MEKVRIDKWLWSVRIFKSRTIATDACKEGKVKWNGVNAKSSQLIQVGDQVEVKKEGFNMQYKVLNLIEKRVGAPIAQACYEDLTPEEELNKFKEWFVGKSGVEYREKGAGRPTKRERREIDDFKDHSYVPE
jgi:ribosome-associated heat shock protein Hsp15